MSIALSTLIHPSKILHFLAILFSIFLIFIGIYIAGDGPLPIFWRIFLVPICFIASIATLHNARRHNTKKWRITINQQGEFRCQMVTVSNKFQDLRSHPTYFLISGTTLWSCILFLRLRRAQGDTTINLVIFSDALSKDEFRRMSVACRWIVKHAK
jgi:hypothetical membrane protein